MERCIFVLCAILVAYGSCADFTTVPTSPSTSTPHPTPSTSLPTPTTTPSTNTTTVTVPASTLRPTVPPEDPTMSLYFDRKHKCVLFHVALQFKFSYKNSLNQNATRNIAMPLSNKTNAIIATCAKGNQVTEALSITFYKDWELKLDFTLEANKFSLRSMSLNYTLRQDLIPDFNSTAVTNTAQLVNETMFETENGTSWQCKTSDDKHVDDVYLQEYVISDLQVQAFRKANTTDFGWSVRLSGGHPCQQHRAHSRRGGPRCACTHRLDSLHHRPQAQQEGIRVCVSGSARSPKGDNRAFIFRTFAVFSLARCLSWRPLQHCHFCYEHHQQKFLKSSSA